MMNVGLEPAPNEKQQQQQGRFDVWLQWRERRNGIPQSDLSY